MNSFKNAYPDIINQLSRRLDVSKIGGYLSGYTDGSLYKYSDNKVLKISDVWWDDPIRKGKMLRFLGKVRETKPSFIVRVYDFGAISSKYGGSDTIWYLMEKLNDLSDKDHLIIQSMSFYNINKNDIKSNLNKIKNGSGYYPGIKLEKRQEIFYKNICNYKNKYHDLHAGNVMTNKNKQLKFIDLESFIITNSDRCGSDYDY
jgi:hypothetical protein